MHDQARVGVSHRGEHVEKHTQPLLDAEAPRVAVSVDGLPVDVLEDEVGLAERRDSSVDEVGDVRVSEAGQEGALPHEALPARPPDEVGVEELDRGRPLEAAVAAAGEPHAAHAASPDERDERVGTDRLPFERRHRRQHRGGVFEEALVLDGRALLEEALHVAREGRVAGAQSREPGRALPGVELERLVEPGNDLPPPLRAEAGRAQSRLVSRTIR